MARWLQPRLAITLAWLLLWLGCSRAVHHEGDFIHTSRRAQFLRVHAQTCTTDWTAGRPGNHHPPPGALCRAETDKLARLDRTPLPKIRPEPHSKCAAAVRPRQQCNRYSRATADAAAALQVAMPINKPGTDAQEVTDYRIQLSFDGGYLAARISSSHTTSIAAAAPVQPDDTRQLGRCLLAGRPLQLPYV